MAAKYQQLHCKLWVYERQNTQKNHNIKLLISPIKEPRVDLSKPGSANDFATNAASVSTKTRIIPNVAANFRPFIQAVASARWADIKKSAELALQLQHHLSDL
jgi:hypothetical protein